MEIYVQNPWARRRVLLTYSLLFFVPALIVFILVQFYFKGLPPQYSTRMAFLVDPHLDPGGVKTAGSPSPSSYMSMDVRTIDLEIKSRERMQESLKGLEIYESKKTEEKQQLFLEQIIENLRVKVERESSGTNAFQVLLEITLPVEDPEQIQILTRKMRETYMKYNVLKYLLEAKERVIQLKEEQRIREGDTNKAEMLLKSFLEDDLNTQYLGDPPPVLEKINNKKKSLAEFENATGDRAEEARKVLDIELKQLEEDFRNNGPSTKRQHKSLLQQRNDALKRLNDLKKSRLQASDHHDFLLDKSEHGFAVILGPVSKPVESEQNSRILLGAALGIMAGLVLVLLGLFLGILGGE